MDIETAAASIVPGRDVAYIARCIDVLLTNSCKDPAILESLQPFLGPKLIENGVIDYGIEPGVDITDRYFVLWEPFLRAKAALLIGTIAEKAESLPDLSRIANILVSIFTNQQSEEIELAFAFFALSQIGFRQPGVILPHFPQLCKTASALVNLAANPPKSFCLFHSVPFKQLIFEAFLDLGKIQGIFEEHDYVQRFIAAGLPFSILQIALCADLYAVQKPELQWDCLYVFLKLVTEHPSGHQLFDADRLPREKINDICTILRFAVTHPNLLGQLRNEVVAVTPDQRTTAGFAALVQKYTTK
jgi:hypothetical protein